MSHSGGPTPDFDPYFFAESYVPKGDVKWRPSGEEDIRRDLLSTEAAFRVAGTIGMVMGVLVFVGFAIPVSIMLRAGGEPGGILLELDWRWDRWVARMASVMTIAILATVTSWGLRWQSPWAWWALILLACMEVIVFPASIAVSRAACSRRGRAVLSHDYKRLIARTPKLSPRLRKALPLGMGLALAMFILYWALLLMFLGTLVACGVLKSI